MTSSDAAWYVAEIFADTIALHQQVARIDPPPIVMAADLAIASLRAGGKILAFGNGGSAADAQHVAAELVCRFERDREGLAAVALVVDPSITTAVANDMGYERVFARQVAALGRRGDVAIAISTSGRSPSVVAGLVEARDRGLRTIALTGRDGGPVGSLAEVHVNVSSESTARVQEVHRTLLHAFCGLVERAFADA
jgi:D-sedoheptulose 7-phosphate isomerase